MVVSMVVGWRNMSVYLNFVRLSDEKSRKLTLLLCSWVGVNCRLGCVLFMRLWIVSGVVCFVLYIISCRQHILCKTLCFLSLVSVSGVYSLSIVRIFQRRCWKWGIPLRHLSRVGRCCSGRKNNSVGGDRHQDIIQKHEHNITTNQTDKPWNNTGPQQKRHLQTGMQNLQQSICRSNWLISIPTFSWTHEVHKKQWPQIGLRATHLAKHSWIWHTYRYYGTHKAITQIRKTNPLRTTIYPNVPPQRLPHRWTIRQWYKPAIPVSNRYKPDVTGPSKTDQYLSQEPLKPILTWTGHSEIDSDLGHLSTDFNHTDSK
jgi:hypothetical protein